MRAQRDAVAHVSSVLSLANDVTVSLTVQPQPEHITLSFMPCGQFFLWTESTENTGKIQDPILFFRFVFERVDQIAAQFLKRNLRPYQGTRSSNHFIWLQDRSITERPRMIGRIAFRASYSIRIKTSRPASEM